MSIQAESENFFKNDLSKEIWETTFRHHDETTPIDTFKRVGNYIASIEKDKEAYEYRFFNELSNLNFVPGGRILANAGTNWKNVSMVNCFTGSRPDYDCDSLDGILEVLKGQALTLKSEGGWGLNFSFIRPRGAFIYGVGVESPGPVKFMELFNTSSDVITSGSGTISKHKVKKGKIRKGAQMAVLGCWHPSIREFITAKQTEGRLTKFNMSVYCTDEFMDKVLEAKNENPGVTWDLVFPDTRHERYKEEWDGDIFLWKSKGYEVIVYETLPVLELWDLIMKSTYNRAEPGILFLDRANKFYCFNYGESRIQETNACVRGDTEILTKSGYIQIKELVNTPTEIWNGFEWSEVIPKITGHNQEMLKLGFSDGRELVTTKYHTFHISTNYRGGQEKIYAIDLKIGDKLIKHEFPIVESGVEFKQAYSQGFYSGDGNSGSNTIWIYGEKDICIPRLSGKTIGKPYSTHSEIMRIMYNLDFSPYPKDFVPMEWNLSSRLNWLAGLFDSDGTELIEGGIQLASIDKNFLRELQKFLSICGVNSKIIFAAEEGMRPLPDGRGGYKEFLCQKLWRICIGSAQCQLLVALGLRCERLKLNKSPNRDASRFTQVVSISEMPIEEVVYCFNEPLKHLGCFNGVVTGQCSEQTMPPKSSCNLLSINLTKVYNPKTKSLDISELENTARTALRFSDNVNDLTVVPLPEYENAVRNLRRVGIGILGWGSLLYLLKTKFASPEAGEIREQIMSTICYSVIDESVNLAIEKGMFVGCIPEKHAECEFFKLINLPEHIKERVRKHGVRNSSFFSIQPTGNTSLFANNVSGGLEPVIFHQIIRTVIVGECPEELRSLVPKYWEGEFYETDTFKFIKEGNEQLLAATIGDIRYKIDRNRGLTKEVLCEDYAVSYLKSIGEWDSKAPWASTTETLTVEEHLSDLKGFTKWLDASCSKTVNIPNDYSFEKFENVYLDAYKSGTIKGVTTYRAGTISSVLKSKDDMEFISLNTIIAPKRPKTLPVEVHCITAKGEKYVVAVGLLNNQPYELFGGHANGFNIKKSTCGEITKIKRGQYSLIIGDLEISDFSTHFTPQEQTIFRMASTMMRHGIPIEFIVDQMQKSTDDIFSLPSAISRVLKKYIKDGQAVVGASCPECEQESIIYSEGCKTCKNCGWAACS